MKTQQLLHIILSALALTALVVILEVTTSGSVDPTNVSWNLLANFLITAVLSIYITNSRFRSYELWLLTFTIFYVIGHFNVIIEAYIFEVYDRKLMMQSMIMGIPYTLIGSLLIVWIHGLMKEGNENSHSYLPRKPLSWLWKILAANFLYIFFYIIAGILIEKFTPGFSEFYAGKLPSLFTFFMTNGFFRGFIFVGIAILIDRSFIGTASAKALLVGLIFSIIGGVAPLIPPSDYMPEFIRIAHGLEVGISNFLYGVCVFLLVRSREAVTTEIA